MVSNYINSFLLQPRPPFEAPQEPLGAHGWNASLLEYADVSLFIIYFYFDSIHA
jgi:hypothetical protein